MMQNILIVEDDMDIQELLQNFLQEVGYRVTIAGDCYLTPHSDAAL